MKELIIDFSWLWNRSLYAFSNLTNSEGIPTGGMYGVLKFHEAIVDKGYRIVACLDDYPEERKRIYEDYKANREPDEFRTKAKKSNQSLFEILDFLGWTFYKVAGCEADDLIASRAMQLAKNNEECVIYSSDKDLQQLMVFPQVKIASQIDKGQFVYKTIQDVVDKIGCEPQFLRVFRPARGDQSDSIPSAVPRVQAKVILPVVKNIQDNLMLGLKLDEAYDKAVESNKNSMTKSAYEKFVSGKNQYITNFLLMDLLKWFHNPIKMEPIIFREMNENLMYNLLDRFELKEFKGNYIDNKMVRGL